MLASDSASTIPDGFVMSSIKLAECKYSLDFMVVKPLCTDVVLSQQFMKLHITQKHSICNNIYNCYSY